MHVLTKDIVATPQQPRQPNTARQPQMQPTTPPSEGAATIASGCRDWKIAVTRIRSCGSSIKSRKIAVATTETAWPQPMTTRATISVSSVGARALPAQPSTKVQRRQLLLDPRSPLQGGVPAKLRAGNAIVYPNLMMHWGSKYTSRFRRTIHMGYRSFNAEIFPYLHQLDWYHQDEFMRYVSADARVCLMRSAELYNRERDQIERTYRAMVAGDKSTFLSDLAQLHPGEDGRMVSVVLLCRIANKVVKLHQPEIAKLSVEERRPIIDGSPPAYYTEDLAARFTVAEAGVLAQRFAVLNNRLREDEDRVHQHYSALYAELKPDAQTPPNFESRSLRTFNSDMPKGFGLDEFIASWKE